MKLVVDTTVFENGFNARSAEVQLLKTFLLDGNAICASDSSEEARNRVRKRAGEAVSRIGALQRLVGTSSGISQINVEFVLENYQQSLVALFNELKVTILPYPSVTHEELVKRALGPVKPFVESGRGYRDALIWFNLVSLLQSGCDKVVFISENSNDWCSSQSGKTFHNDFVKELNGLGLDPIQLEIVPNLGEFNRKYTVGRLPEETEDVNVEEPRVDYLQLLRDGEDALGDQILMALPDLFRRKGDVSVIGEVALFGMGAPAHVSSEPPRRLDAERTLLQFSAEYRVSIEIFLFSSQVSEWTKHFSVASVSLKQDLGDGLARLYVTLPLRILLHMIKRGENTEQFSIVSMEILEG